MFGFHPFNRICQADDSVLKVHNALLCNIYPDKARIRAAMAGTGA